MKLEMLLLIMLAFASEQTENEVDSVAKSVKKSGENSEENLIFVKIEEDEYVQKKNYSDFIGVTYNVFKGRTGKWRAQRWSKSEGKKIYNGYYKDEETAARASDTLARKLMKNGGQTLDLNFPDDDTEVHKTCAPQTSLYFGVGYNNKISKWYVQRRSKIENKKFSNGSYDDEKKAAHASDTLARKFMKNGEHGHKLNFPDDHTEVYAKEKNYSKYIGVSYDKRIKRWVVMRWSKTKNTCAYNGSYKDEETAGHGSDNLARKLMANGEQNHRLNFPDNNLNRINKRKRLENEDLGYSQNK